MRKFLSIGLAIALATVALLSALPVLASPGWLLGGWDQRVKLTVDNTDVDNTLTNFPVLVYLSANSGRNSDDVSFVFDELTADANRKKIAVTTDNGVTECYVEIEKWDDANEKAWLWVKVPSIASGTDTDLYLYYDIDQADNTTYVGDTNSVVAENVWDANFIGVWHMRDGADTSHIYDSTSNDNDGTKRDAAEPAITTSGKISDAQDFDGANDYIGLAQNFMAAPTDLTMEVWFKTAMAGAGVLVDVEGAYTMIVGWKTVGKIAAIADGSSANYVESGVVNDDDWHHAVLVSDGSLSTLYIDGGSVDTAAETLYDIDTLARVSAIGTIWGASGNWFNGLLDEVRISSTDRGAAWIKASCESEVDDLLAFDGEEYALTLPPTNFMLTINGNNILGSWTLGQYAITTIVIRGENRFPDSLTDGTEVYNDIGTSFTDTDLGIELTQYYYSAWSHNDGGYSDDYTEGRIGGEGMLLMTIVILALGLTIAAFVIRSGMLYMTCVPAWLIFTFVAFNATWPGENTYIPTAVAIFGVAMTIVMVAVTGMHYIGNRSSEPTYDEEKAANLRKIYKITHKKNPWED